MFLLLYALYFLINIHFSYNSTYFTEKEYCGVQCHFKLHNYVSFIRTNWHPPSILLCIHGDRRQRRSIINTLYILEQAVGPVAPYQNFSTCAATENKEYISATQVLLYSFDHVQWAYTKEKKRGYHGWQSDNEA